MRRTGLMVPQRKLRQVGSRRRLERPHEILDRRRVAVMALEIEVHTGAELVRPEDRADHAHDLGALFVDGRRVEIVDLAVAPRPHRMRQRSLVLGELVRLQRAHLRDALHRARPLVGGELMVAEDGQPFLQAELEPVAASDSVACPIVEILMRDDRLDIGEIGVGGRHPVGQHVFVVEDVEALVLHGPHIEVGHGDDVEHVEVVFEPEHLLVPAHRPFQRIHCVGGPCLLAMLDINAELHRASRHGGEGVANLAEIPGHQREQVGRLREGVVPLGEMPAFGKLARGLKIAV